jgi:hypothetical protein
MQTVDGPVLVGGIGLPWLPDLDFALKLARAEGQGWPAEVLVEDLSLPAHQFMDRMLEIAPSAAVLVVSTRRGFDPPGTVRHSVLDLTPPSDEEVHRSLVESVTLGIVDLDHILAVTRYWKVLPEGTVLIEVEADDRAEPDLRPDVDLVGHALALVRGNVATRSRTSPLRHDRGAR